MIALHHAVATAVVALGVTLTSSALATDLSITNHTNTRIACAALREGPDWAVETWFVIEREETGHLGEVHAAYCEEVGNPNLRWEDLSRGPLVTACVPAEFDIRIIHSALDPATCGNLHGVMRGFTRFPAGSFTWTLER